MKHLQLWAQYAAARIEHEKASRLAADLENAKRKIEQELVDAMLDEGLKSFKLEGGVTISLRKRFDCSVNQENAQQVEDWLMEKYGDVRPFQKFVLYKPAVVAQLKSEAEKGKLDETKIPAFLNLKQTPGITVRGFQGASDDE